MARVRVVHWREAEAGALIEACRAAGHLVEYEAADLPATARIVRTSVQKGVGPEALVIDLSCRPASGRQLAFAIRGTKYTRQIPLIFVDGEPDKVEPIRRLLPDAIYASRKRVASGISKACKQVLPSPATPPTLMQMYGGRTTAEKLGVKPGSSVGLFDAPRDYFSVIGDLPDGVELVEEPDEVHPVTLWFVRDPREYLAGLRRKSAMAARTKFWVIWRKGSTNGLTGNLVREGALDAGLVDYKICSVDSKWSGMVFAVKKK